MKAVLGILLIGGGAFLLVALFNGTLQFPLGNINQMAQASPPVKCVHPDIPGSCASTGGVTNMPANTKSGSTTAVIPSNTVTL